MLIVLSTLQPPHASYRSCPALCIAKLLIMLFPLASAGRSFCGERRRKCGKGWSNCRTPVSTFFSCSHRLPSGQAAFLLICLGMQVRNGKSD